MTAHAVDAERKGVAGHDRLLSAFEKQPALEALAYVSIPARLVA